MILFAASLIMSTSCKKDEVDDNTDTNTPETKSYVVVIDNGAQNIEPNESVTYTAILVDNSGNITTPSGVTWTTSSSSIATISSGGIITTAGTGNISVTASVSVDGKTISASVPLGIYSPTVFLVAPSAIIYEVGGSIQLETVFFTTGTAPTYSYTSSSSSIASVSSTGLVTFNAIGECYISVTASTVPDQPFIVPVLVIGEPEVILPVTRVELDKASADLFKNETLQLHAKAYNPNGEVTGKTFTWTSSDPSVATVDASGNISPIKTGQTYVKASCNGVFAQAEILVNPDTVVLVTPFYVDLQPGETQQFTATAYKNERGVTLNTAQQYAINFSWEIPTYGAGFEMFDIGTVDGNGMLTVKPSAMVGMSSFVVAYDPNNYNAVGVAMIMIGYGF